MTFITSPGEITRTLDEVSDILDHTAKFEGPKRAELIGYISRYLTQAAMMLERLLPPQGKPAGAIFTAGSREIVAIRPRSLPYGMTQLVGSTVEPDAIVKIRRNIKTKDPYDPYSGVEDYFGFIDFIPLSRMATAIHNDGASLSLNPEYVEPETI